MNRIIAIIPARGGSKGIPGKNLSLLGGIPLIAWTLKQAISSEALDRVIVSTDSREIAEVATGYNAEVIWRPAHLASDTSSSESAINHVLEELYKREKYVPTHIVFLQATSPFRHNDDIDRAIEFMIKNEFDSVLSVVSSHNFLWKDSECGAQPINYDYCNRPRRQDMDPQYKENGSIYIFKYEDFMKCQNRLVGKIGLYHMTEDSDIDIDSPLDLEIARMYIKGNT